MSVSVLDRYVQHDAPPIFLRALARRSAGFAALARRRRPSARAAAARRPGGPASGRLTRRAASGRCAAGRRATTSGFRASTLGARKSGSIGAYLESQSFFRSYGSILPTSLVCIVRYRPEATRLGDLLRSIGTRSHEIQLHLLGFSRDDPEAPDDARTDVAFRPRRPPLLRLTRFRGRRTSDDLTKKRELFPGSRVIVSEGVRVAARPRRRPRGPRAEANLRVEARESMPDSLSVGQGPEARRARPVPAVSRRSPPPSGAATPRSIDVRVEPFSTSAFEGFA